MSAHARRRKLKPVNQADRVTRSLRALEHTASTSRVLNLLAIEAESGHRPEYGQQPLFKNKLLNTALIIKHRLRNDDLYLFDEARQTATKVIIPFDRDDLKYGGQSVFVGQRGWAQMLIEACNASGNLSRDLETLEAIDALPSLDPFLLREHLRRHRIAVAGCYFTLSPADYEAMQGFVSMEISHLIELAYRDAGGLRRIHSARLVEALLAADVDERLEPLRDTLVMEGASFREGVFSWKGFLYYKWMLTKLWPMLTDVGAEISAITVTGQRDAEADQYLEGVRKRLQGGVMVERAAIMRTLKVYDDAFESLTNNGRPQQFRDFLLRAPELFLSLGERVGVISHISSFWRYRFPKGEATSVHVDEAIDIFMDFEANLSPPPNT
ncbi:hypothetical protein [Caulobacter segnis]|uniref:hypothetical protein n=1 Tax=Caulobacter segnis TaxID=88688 RepID=UPI001CBCA8C1|nr:hypothetical protein [Caulobacter segnis]UAL11478.1 hypothetical protein K8940_04065 [Caulobacter segnis]